MMSAHYLKFLIALPVLTYAASYLYLALYHGKSFLFNTVVHEGGTYSLLQSLFYASHYLGHVPVHIVLAFFFTGCYLCLSGDNPGRWTKRKIQMLSAVFVLFLVSTAILSITVFGYEDTFSFITQKKQGVGIYRDGGAWNLHLPSTVLLFVFIPVYIYVVKKICDKNVLVGTRGMGYLAFGFALFLSFTFVLNRHNITETLCLISSDPRYLAHGVRELLTFPLTYFPIPLYFFLREEKERGLASGSAVDRKLAAGIIFLLIIFMAGLFYEASIPLSKGIDNLAQRPAFAKGGKLGIPYLLASHYFEHFLDTIFFALFCLLLYGFASRFRRSA
jgi:hypothetical protein